MVEADAPGTNTRSISSWRGLLFRSSFATLVIIGLITVIAQQVIPPFIVFFALIAGGMWWLGRAPGNRRPVTFLLVVSGLFLLLNLPFAIDALAHPESGFEFALTGAIMMALIVAVVAAVAELRRTAVAAGTPRLIGMAALAVVVLMGVGGAIAQANTENDEAVAGDVRLGAKAIKWTEKALTARAGTVSILVDNADTSRHDFTIKDKNADVSADLPASKKRRVTFDAVAGSYEYICTLHPDMSGTLTVT